MLLARRMNTAAIQALVEDLSLVREFSGVWLLPGHHFLLSILHILEIHVVRNEMIII